MSQPATTANVTKTEIAAALACVQAIAAAIKEAGPQGIPSGHLYAALMGKLSIENYEKCIGILVRSKVIEKRASHLLVSLI